MIKIEVKSEAVRVKSGTAAKTGKAYSIPEQEGWAYTFNREGQPNPYPVRVVFSLRDGQPPYPLGVYMLAPESLFTNRFDQLELSAILKPVAVAAQKAA